MEKIVYRFVENWDGGNASKYYTSIEECYDQAIQHVKEIRWTAKEMEEQARLRQNTVLIEKVFLDEDGNEDCFEETLRSIEVNENTVERVY